MDDAINAAILAERDDAAFETQAVSPIRPPVVEYAVSPIPPPVAEYAVSPIPPPVAEYAVSPIHPPVAEYAVSPIHPPVAEYAVSPIPPPVAEYAVSPIHPPVAEYAVSPIHPPVAKNVVSPIPPPVVGCAVNTTKFHPLPAPKEPAFKCRHPYTYYASEPYVSWDQKTNELILSSDIATGPYEKVRDCTSHKRNYKTGSTIVLNKYLAHRNGQIVWDRQGGFHSHVEIMHYNFHRRHQLELTYKLRNGNVVATTIDLSRHIARTDDGDLEYVDEPTVYPNAVGFPGYNVDPLKDGNIQPSAFTVASDVTKNHCRVAYKTQIYDKVALAEISYKDGHWHDPTEILTWASKMPGANFALVLDPKEGDPDRRHFFFSEPDGDGYIYQQTCEHKEWKKPRKPRDLHGKEMAIKAHRFSGFAATYDHKNKLILFYFVDESNSLLEYAGKFYEEDKMRRIPAGYRWTRTQSPDAENLTLREHIAVIADGGKTYLVYRGRDHELIMAIGKNRKSWEVEAAKTTQLKRGDKRGDAEWTEFVIRDKSQLAKYSPLAVAIGPGNFAPKVFYLHKDRKTETIMALDIEKTCNVYEILTPVPVGKLEPGSDIAAASLPNSRHPIRVFSVSKLDGDNVLLERVQRPTKISKELYHGSWVISGGVVDTDVDYCDPSPHSAERASTADT